MKSKMLKSKSFKLEKPKKGDSWAKFVEWNRRWNKILSVIFGILSFSLLFAIVLANILHTDYKNYEIVTTTSTTTTTTTTSTTEEPVMSTTEMMIEEPTTEPSTTEAYVSTTLPPPLAEPTTTSPYDLTTTSTEGPTPTMIWSTTFSASPPIITTIIPTVGVVTTLSGKTESTSSSVLPGAKCGSKTCELSFCILVLANCNVTCEDAIGNEDILSNILQLLTKLVCSSIELSLVNCEFSEKSLRGKWLDIKSKVLRLEIDSNLERIEAGAFNHNIFSGTHTLTIKNSQIMKLESVFAGLSSLTTLSFYGAQFQEIMGDAFSELANLHTLNLEDNEHTIRLENVTGSSLYTNILSVSLRYNDIRSMPAQSFIGVPSLQNIFLQGSRIAYIDPQAFEDSGDNLRDVHLNDNLLSTVEPGVFPTALKKSSLHIYLEGNPFHCFCTDGMAEMQSLMSSGTTSSNFPGEVECQSPPAQTGVLVKDASLDCHLTTTARVLSTPFVSTTTTPRTPPTTVIGTPSHHTTLRTTPLFSDDPDGTTSDEVIHTRTPPLAVCPSNVDGTPIAELTIIQKSGHRFNLTEVDDGAVLVQVHPNAQDYVYLLWFMNTFLEYDSGVPCERSMACRAEMETSQLIENLTTNSVYTFCMISVINPEVTPFECLSIYLQPSKFDQAWLTNRDRPKAYTILAVIILTMFVLGVFLTCLCLRRSINSHRGQIHATSTSHDVMRMPPLPKRNAKMMFHRNSAKPLQRSISDTSLASGRSYVSAINPSPFEIISWKMDRNRMHSHPGFYNLEKMPESAPPIPPPKRPSDTSHYSNVDEIYERSRCVSNTYAVGGSVGGGRCNEGSNHYMNYRV